jgi:nucleoside-diphosphate-sugar epimerase
VPAALSVQIPLAGTWRRRLGICIRDLSMTPVLVTGGAGFIGSHTCKALRNGGFSPVCYDDLSRGNAAAVKWGELVIGDIADGRLLRDT